jgi:hypothetical protein
MENKSLSFLLRFLLFLTVFSKLTIARAQVIDSSINRYGSHSQPEKAYLHYDKSAYTPGETIWFKAYLMSGIFPVEDSKTLYTDWIDDNGAVLYHSVSPIMDGTTNGQFLIPENYAGHFIHVHAYTRWMLNFDSAFQYNKDIRIIQKAAAVKQPRPAVVPSIQFFPEGGDLVTGVPNRVAFKANDQWGRPVRIKGVLLNGKGARMDSLRTLHDGMGSFLLTPEPGIHYTARWKDEKGAEHTSELPTARTQGITMQVALEPGKRILYLNGSKELPENDKILHVVGTINQQMAFKTDALLSPGGSVKKVVPIDNFPSGIMTVTVFDQNWKALAERVTFINNHEYTFQPTMEVVHWGLNKRARDVVQITVPDSLQADLSVSVTDASIERDTADNIISHLLLTSDIKGYVHDPAYYFSSDADSVVQGLDLVMLTHGWRRFKWEDVIQGRMPAITYSKDTSYLSLSGTLYGVSKGQFGPSDNVILFIKGADAAPKMVVMPILSDGRFEDPNSIFFDTLHVYYQVKSKSNSHPEVRFMTDRLPAPNYAAFSKAFAFRNSFYYDTTGFGHHFALASEEARLAGIQRGKALEAVTVTAHTKSPMQILDERYASSLFQSMDSYQFDLVNDKMAEAYQNIFQYLQGKVAGLNISMNGSQTSLSWRGGAPSVYINEVPSTVDMLSNVSVSDIAYVKVFRPPFMGGFNGGSGAIAIYTRKGNDLNTGASKGLANNTIIGYSPVKQFYSPNYDAFDPKNEQPDMRTTLYWNPRITTKPGQHIVQLTFYNNDLTQSFRVVIEGMTREGLLTHYEQIME